MDNFIEKYTGFRAELAVIETIEEIRMLETKAMAVAEFAKKSKMGIEEQNEWGKFRCEIEAKKGKWLDEFFPHGAKPGTNNKQVLSSEITSLENIGITFDESADARLIAKTKEKKIEEAINKVVESGRVVEPKKVAYELRKMQRTEEEKAAINQARRDVKQKEREIIQERERKRNEPPVESEEKKIYKNLLTMVEKYTTIEQVKYLLVTLIEACKY